jgi:L,D-transpeptidase catalytic domain
MTPSTLITTVTAAVLTSALLGGCSGPDNTPATSHDDRRVQRAVSARKATLTVRERPASDAPITARLSQRTPLGSPRVLLVESTTSGWVRVSLPTRPNGSHGWVRQGDMRLEPVTGKITVDRGTRQLIYQVDGREVARSSVAIGSPANPTPAGAFFVTDRVQPRTRTGAYGSFALGLSAHSTTLTEFGSGDGQIGIHGTDQDDSIGRAVSHGCIRVPDDVADTLRSVPLGTPVHIA